MIVTECRMCGTPLTRYPSQMRHLKHGPFCSRDCLGRYRTERLVEADASNWREGIKRDRAYVRVYAPWVSGADQHGYIALHRLVAQLTIGRALGDDEIVHHRDGDPMNNDPTNLVVMTRSDHIAVHRPQMLEARRGR